MTYNSESRKTCSPGSRCSNEGDDYEKGLHNFAASEVGVILIYNYGNYFYHGLFACSARKYIL